MNGELAQIISLVAHGNLFLQRGAIDLTANFTFQYVSSIKYCRYKSPQDAHGELLASSVSEWLDYLRSTGATRLWNIAFAWQRKDLPEHVAISFSGGVPKAIQADLPNGFELWYPLWKPGGTATKPWVVEYRGLFFPTSQALPLQKMSAVKNQLQQAVLRAEWFSKSSEVNASVWTSWFTKSLELLESPNPQAPFHPDMLPSTGFSLEARQILASAVQSYVFGGMGSWNDMGFAKPEIQELYNRITKELYEAIKIAIVMASNSFQG